jgi:hypothetical protein
MQEFEVRVERLRRSKSSCENGFVLVPAAGQHEYIFHHGRSPALARRRTSVKIPKYQ